ncbi:MAG: hypothetical protein LBG58_10575 [Planctomycetaceae bacterium]|jgi:hypothetical protein|nr:hypothetical protein [Planctomycetaceae bacterium]
MKKLITLSLMTVCFGLFALGCTPKPAAPTAPSGSDTPPATEATTDSVPADAAKDVEKPTEEKPAEETPAN